MIKRPISGLIHMGNCLRYLQDAREGLFITHENEGDLHMDFVKGALGALLKHLDVYGLVVTARAASDLREFRDLVKDRPVNSTLNATEANKLKDIITILETTLRAEAEGMHSFFSVDKTIPSSKLTDRQDELFPKGVFDELSEIAKYDVREAGTCLAFERSTASAFHILRATEDVLREFYCRIVRQNRVSKFMWGNMTSDLAGRRKRPSDIVLKNLDYIRENFRNPTAHPEARFDIHEAASVFNLCLDVIARMVRDPLWKK